jgi:hypothetical protein
MSKKYGNNTKTKTKAIMKFLLMKVLAEEPEVPPVVPPVDPPKVVNFEDLVAKARKEEKDKLYPQIEALKKSERELTEKNNALLLSIESKDQELSNVKDKLKVAEEGSSKSDSEAVTSLKKELKKAEKALADAVQLNVDAQAIEDKVRAEFEVKLYRETKLRESKEIIEELVTGTTREEIDNSFEVAKARYASIKGEVATATFRDIPPANVSTNSLITKDFKIEDLANMDVRSPEYKEMRKKLGL